MQLPKQLLLDGQTMLHVDDFEGVIASQQEEKRNCMQVFFIESSQKFGQPASTTSRKQYLTPHAVRNLSFHRCAELWL